MDQRQENLGINEHSSYQPSVMVGPSQAESALGSIPKIDEKLTNQHTKHLHNHRSKSKHHRHNRSAANEKSSRKYKAHQYHSANESALFHHSPYFVEAGLIILSLGIPLMLGGVHKFTILLATAISLITFFFLWYRRQVSQRNLEVPWLGLVFLGATVYSMLQLVPLPMGLLKIIAPASAELLRMSYSGLSAAPRWHAVSLDPYATVWEILKVGTCSLAFIISHNFYSHRKRDDRLFLWLVVGGMVLTIVSVIGALVKPGQPLMLYTPEVKTASGLITTTFINSNHSAAFLMICTVMAIGLAVAVHDVQQRGLYAIAGIFLGAGTFLTLSRGGIVALAASLGLLALLVASMKIRQEKRWGISLVPAGLALILGLSAWLAFDAILNEFRQLVPKGSLDLGKINFWPAGWAMLKDNWLTGVGRGTFFTSFTRYITPGMPTSGTYSHLENEFLQLPIEWGIIVGGGVIIALATALVIWFWRCRNDLRVILLCTIFFGLAIHNLLDFNMEMLGLALPASILAGVISARYARQKKEEAKDSLTKPSTKESKSVESFEQVSEKIDESGHILLENTNQLATKTPVGKLWLNRALLFGFIPALLICGVSAAATWRFSTENDFSKLASLHANSQTSDAQFMSDALKVIKRHPSDYLPQLLVAQHLTETNLKESLPWYNRALFLNPLNPEIHLQTARALRRLGQRRQALIEYRLAMENGAPVANTIARALSLTRNEDDLYLLLAAQPEAWTSAVKQLIAAKRIAHARTIGEAGLNRFNDSAPLAEATVTALLHNQEKDLALKISQDMVSRRPSEETFQIWARVALEVQGIGSDIPILQQARDRFPGDVNLAIVLAQAYLRAKEINLARAIAEELMRNASTPGMLASMHDLMAEIQNADGRPHSANWEREQARKIRSGGAE